MNSHVLADSLTSRGQPNPIPWLALYGGDQLEDLEMTLG